MSLNPKQVRFAKEYLVDLNATQAAIRAGYSKKTAYSAGGRLLKNVEVQKELAKGKQKLDEKTELTAEYVRTTLMEVVGRCMQRKRVMVREGRHMVQKEDDETGEGVWEFDSAGVNRAAELLGKHLGMFVDKSEVTYLQPPALAYVPAKPRHARNRNH